MTLFPTLGLPTKAIVLGFNGASGEGESEAAATVSAEMSLSLMYEYHMKMKTVFIIDELV
jgi:hypothetical protein